MTLDGSSSPVPTPAPGSTPADVGSMAEDAAEHQHPVLRRLQGDGAVGTAVRRGALWAAGSRVVSQLLQFLGLIVSARLLVPSDYGSAAVVAPVLAFGGLFANLGMASAVIHARRVTEELLSTAFWMCAAAAVVLTSAVAGLAVPLSRLYDVPTLAPLLLLASLLFVINLSSVHLALLERTLRFKTVALIETGAVVLAVLTIIGTAAAGAGPFSLVWGPLVNQAATTVGVWAAVRWRPHVRPDRDSARQLWAYSRGLTGFRLLNFWSHNADNLLLARVVSLAELGNYNRAYNLMKLPVIQTTTLMGRVLFPALSRLRDDRARLGQAWLRALSLTGALTAPLTLGMAVTAPAFIEVLFGRRWLGMVTVLQLLAVSALPQTLSATAGGLLQAVGATNTLFRTGVVTSTLSVSAILLGLRWGTVGVATALMVKFYLEVYICLRPCLPELQLRWSDLVRATRGVWLACLAMAAVGVLVRAGVPGGLPAAQVLIAQVAACGVTYTAVLWWVDRRSLLLLLQLFGRLRRPGGLAA